MKYILFKDKKFLKEVVFTGIGIRTTTELNKACVYNNLEVAEQDAEDHDFFIFPLGDIKML